MTEPLVLVPGLLQDARIWGPQIAALSPTHALHLPPIAHGETVEAMAVLSLEHAPAQFSLAGIGFGGNVALEIARRAPERVRRLCLISTECLTEIPGSLAERELQIAIAKAGRVSDAVHAVLPETNLADGPNRTEIQKFIEHMACDLGAQTVVRMLKAAQRRGDQQSIVRRLRRMPVIVVAGREDKCVSLRRQELMATMIGGAVFHVIDNAGHLPTLEAPNALLALMPSWLDVPVVERLVLVSRV